MVESERVCQVVYVLNVDRHARYRGAMNKFEWLYACDITDIRSICYGNYTYYIWITTHVESPTFGRSFCGNREVLVTGRSFLYLVIHEYRILNSTFELITSLRMPCTTEPNLSTTFASDEFRRLPVAAKGAP